MGLGLHHMEADPLKGDDNFLKVSLETNMRVLKNSVYNYGSSLISLHHFLGPDREYLMCPLLGSSSSLP